MKERNLEDVYELSPMQQGILFHTLADPRLDPYLEQSVMTLRGALDVPRFRAAWQRVAARHPILRTTFHWEGLDKPVQVVHGNAEVPVASEDWRGMSPALQRDGLKGFLQEDHKTGFDLTSPPLLRVALFRTAEDVHDVVLTFQHLIFDRWSRFLVLKDVFGYYAGPIDGEDLQPSPRPYGDFIAWLQAQDSAQGEEFWRRELAGFTAPTALVGGGKRDAPTERRFEGARLCLSAASSAHLRSFARSHRLTLNTLVQGAWAILAGRYSGEEDVLFGTTVTARPTSLAGADSMVGLFLNTLPVRIRVSDRDPALAWLRKVQTTLLDVRQHEHGSLLDIQGWSEVPRGTPLFESLVVFENVAEDFGPLVASAGLELLKIRPNEDGTSYPLTVFVTPGPELSLQIVADGALFDREAVARMLGHLATLLAGLVSDVDLPLWRISMLTAPERRQVLVEWNGTEADYPAGRCLHEIFEAQVELRPDAPAVRDASGELTYGALNRKANRIAHFLRGRGVARGEAVGVCLERSTNSVAALLGILKAGGAYVPLDPSHPHERLAFILRDSGARILLSDSRSASRNTSGPWETHLVDDRAEMSADQATNPERVVGSEDLAYIIYTSGSTGTPKGVEAVHRASVNRFEWMWRTYPFLADEVCCQKTTHSFVDSVWEIFGPLLQGIPSVVLPEEVVRDPRALVESLSRSAVTRIVLVPSLLRALLDSGLELAERLPLLNLWVSSGETLPMDLYRQFRLAMPHAVLINLYGSSEVAADVTCYDGGSLDPPNSVPIGRPISNIRIYILDRHRQPVPVGVRGDLWIGGGGLARGYRNRPALTADRFCPDPFSDAPGARLFKTGDRGRYLPDGQIEYLGREDDQIKLRGQRIEVGEVETALARHPEVAASAVAARSETSGEMRLVAYVVGRPGNTLSTTGLRAFLGMSLPSPMIPSAFVLLDALPLTPNGKVDRNALPTPEPSPPEPEDAYVAPRTPVEEVVARIWAEVLRLERIGVTADFFALGGHSLRATQIISRVREAFQVELPLRALFEVPTVAGLAREVENEKSRNPVTSSVRLVPASREGRRMKRSDLSRD